MYFQIKDMHLKINTNMFKWKIKISSKKLKTIDKGLNLNLIYDQISMKLQKKPKV